MKKQFFGWLVIVVFGGFLFCLFLLFAGTLHAQIRYAHLPPQTQKYGAVTDLIRYDERIMTGLGGASIKNEGNTPMEILAKEADNRSFFSVPPGGSVRFAAIESFGGIIIRFSLADAPMGGGTQVPMNVRNETSSAEVSVTLDSKYAWIYGNVSHEETDAYQSGRVLRAYDHTNFKFAGSEGDIITFTNAGTTGVIWIDFIETDHVPAPIPAPAGAVVVTGGNIQAAVNAAPAGGTVYIPAGNYTSTSNITIPKNITLQGAGMWHTEIQVLSPALNGIVTTERSTVVIKDFHLRLDARQRRNSMNGLRPNTPGYGDNSIVESVWMSHASMAMWVGNSNGTIYRNCRVFDSFGDGITSFGNVNNFERRNNIIRHSGDDGLGLNDGTNNTIISNTVEFTVYAGGIGVFGGNGSKISGNLVRNTFATAQAPLRAALVFSVGDGLGPTPTIFENNLMEDNDGCWGQIFIHLRNYPATNLIFTDNTFTGVRSTSCFLGLVTAGGPTLDVNSLLVDCQIKNTLITGMPANSPTWHLGIEGPFLESVKGRVEFINLVRKEPEFSGSNINTTSIIVSENNIVTTEASIEFVETSDSRIDEVVCYPNPVTDHVWFMFSHNLPGALFSVTVELFDQCGKCVERFEREVPSDGTKSIRFRWAPSESNVALVPGMYRGRFTITSEQGYTTVSTGNFVLMK